MRYTWRSLRRLERDSLKFSLLLSREHDTINPHELIAYEPIPNAVTNQVPQVLAAFSRLEKVHDSPLFPGGGPNTQPTSSEISRSLTVPFDDTQPP